MSDRMKLEIDRQLSDRILFAAANEAIEPNERVAELVSTQDEYLERLDSNWVKFRADDPGYTASTIHTAMAVGVIPSLIAKIDGQPQAHEVARETSTKLNGFCNTILETGVLFRRGRHEYQNLREAAGELALLAAMWHGIKRAELGDITHVIPATSEQDQGWLVPAEGTTRQRNRKYSIDLLAMEDDPKYQWPIQAKQRAGSRRRSDRKWYDLGITTLYLEDDKLGDRNIFRPLLQRVVEEDTKHLSAMSEHILKKIAERHLAKLRILNSQDTNKDPQET